MGNSLSRCCCCCWNASRKQGRCSRCSDPDHEPDLYEVVAGNTESSPAALQSQELEVRASQYNQLPPQHKTDLEAAQVHEKMKSKHVWPTNVSKIYSSCPTLFMYTMRKTDLEMTLKGMSLTIYYHIKTRRGNRSVKILDERSPLPKPVKVPKEYVLHDPELNHIYGFLCDIFSSTKLAEECAVTTLIYIDRLTANADIDLCPMNWRRIVLGAILVATMWDNQSLWTVYNSKILQDFTVEDMDAMGCQVAELLRFDMDVTPTVYNKYTFYLNFLTCDSDMISIFATLKKQTAQTLEVWPTHLKRTYSSCPTLLMSNTEKKSDLEMTLKGMSLTIYYHMTNRCGNRSVKILDERSQPVKPVKVPKGYVLHDPELNHIYGFLCDIFSSTNLREECAITTLIYIERLIANVQINICPMNWRRIVLGAILVSAMWDNESLLSVHNCKILQDFTVEDMDAIGCQVVELLQFNVDVTPSVYNKYTFYLHSLACDSDIISMFAPIKMQRSENLEAMAGLCKDDTYSDLSRAAMRSSLSGHNIIAVQ